jgi:hypothetical protein
MATDLAGGPAGAELVDLGARQAAAHEARRARDRAAAGRAAQDGAGPAYATLSVEADVPWLPDEDFTQRYLATLDALARLVAQAGVVDARYLCCSRPERRMTTAMLEGRVLVLPAATA